MDQNWWQSAVLSLVTERAVFMVAIKVCGEEGNPTPKHVFGIGNASIECQDVVFLVNGCQAPIVVRTNPKIQGTFTVVGESFFPILSKEPTTHSGEAGTSRDFYNNEGYSVVLNSWLRHPLKYFGCDMNKEVLEIV